MFACGSFPFCLLQWDDLDLVSFFPVVSHYGLSEWFLYVVYDGDGVQSVVVRGVLTLYEL